MKYSCCFVNLFLTATALLFAGCVAYDEGWVDDELDAPSAEENFEAIEQEIIGGTTVSVPARRAAGLVDVNDNCSGSLFHRDWVLTATHCLNRGLVVNNTFSIPRTGGGLDTRRGNNIITLGASDLSLVYLSPITSDMMWPNVTRTMNAASPQSLIGQSVTCYGRGNSAYRVPGPGVEGFGQWRRLVKTVSGTWTHPTFGTQLRIDANSLGGDITAFGDSGGPCFTGNQVAAIFISVFTSCPGGGPCGNTTSTVVKIEGGGLGVTSTFANYIQQTPHRQYSPIDPIELESGWSVPTYGSMPEYVTGVGSVIHLRGTLQSQTLSSPFTLPSWARPSQRVYVPVFANAGGINRNARLQIESNGYTQIQFEGGTPPGPFIVSLDGVQFVRQTTSTTSLTLQNGWSSTVYDTRAPRYRRLGNMVYLLGAISNSSQGANPVAFALPANARPPNNVYVPVDMCGSTRGRLWIQPNGTVTIQSEGSFGNATCFTSLDGAAFSIASTGYTFMSPLQNGWFNSPYATRPLGFINDAGIVRFQGAIAGGSSQLVTVLPPQFRPARGQFFWIDGCNARKTWAYVSETGHLYARTVPNGHDSCFASFEGASFAL